MLHKKGRPKGLKEGKHLQIDHPSGQGKQPPASALGQIARPETRARPARRKYQCASSKLNNPHLLPRIKSDLEIPTLRRVVSPRATSDLTFFCSSVATSSSFTALLRTSGRLQPRRWRGWARNWVFARGRNANAAAANGEGGVGGRGRRAKTNPRGFPL